MTGGTYLLGIDIGGTGVKTGVIDLEGRLHGQGYCEYKMISNLPGQAEHDAESWWQSAVMAIRHATEGIRTGEILAIGIGCTNGLIPVDREAKPLRSAIMLWDQRALPEVEKIRQRLDPDTVFSITGNPVAPGAYSLPTILWLKQSDPELFKSTYKLMVPGGYLVSRLTGEFTIDYSRACTTLLFDIRKHKWHSPFLDALEIDEDKLPTPLPCDQVAGRVTKKAAEITGLKQGTPVIAGCMDTVGASIGSGVLRPGECFIIMGTAARVSSPLNRPIFDKRFMNCTHVEQGRWLSIGAVNGVGSTLRWIRDTFGHMEKEVAEHTGTDSYDLLTQEASLSPPGSKGLLFLPYISGERTPIWNPYARGVFFGITLGHKRNDFMRSALEGAAFAIRHVIEILETDGGMKINELRMGGAAARNSIWNQIISDVLGKPISITGNSQTEVLGAAVLAGVGIGVFTDYPSVLETIVSIKRVFTPEPMAHEAYSNLFKVYKDIYPDVEKYFKRLAMLDLPQVWIRKGDKR